MKALLATVAVLAALTAPAAAAPKAKLTGPWCHMLTIKNGHSATTGEAIPPTNTYRRQADCPIDKQITLGPRSLKGLEYRLDDDGELAVEGWPEPAKGKR